MSSSTPGGTGEPPKQAQGESQTLASESGSDPSTAMASETPAREAPSSSKGKAKFKKKRVSTKNNAAEQKMTSSDASKAGLLDVAAPGTEEDNTCKKELETLPLTAVDMPAASPCGRAFDWPAAVPPRPSGAHGAMPIVLRSEGASTNDNSNAARLQAMELMQRKRRWFRPLSVLVVAIILFIVWFFATFSWLYITMSAKEYSSDTFTLAVSACAVKVHKGSKRQVIVEGQISSLDVSSEPLPLRVLTVKNRQGCLHVPFFNCSKVCHVFIEVPDNGAPQTLQIYQLSEDRTPGLTVQVEQVTLESLSLRGSGGNWWDFAGPTLELSMNGVTVNGALYASLVQGAARIESSTLNGAVRLISQENSVQVIDVPVPDASKVLQLDWRQISQRVYIGVTKRGIPNTSSNAAILPVIDADPGGAFSPCEYNFYTHNFNLYYDVDNDGFVDIKEFIETVSVWQNYWKSMGMCCGSRCPFATWCDGLGYQIFTLANSQATGGSYSDRATYLSTSAIWNKVRDKDGIGAMLVPSCHRRLNAGPSAATAWTHSWKLEAGTDGEVRVLLRSDASTHAGTSLTSLAQTVDNAYYTCKASNTDDATCQTARMNSLSENMELWCSSTRSPSSGLRLLGVDAKILQQEVGKDFGDLLTVKDALVVIDVEGSPGIPGSRWLYSTRPVFISIDPAVLFILSAGLLVPNLKHFRVRLVDTSCDLNFTNSKQREDGTMNYVDQDARLVNVYEQLYFGLHSDGLSIFNVGIRGQLVLLRKDDDGNRKAYEFVKVSQGWEMKEKQKTQLDKQMHSAIWLSFALGGILAMMGLLSAWKYLKWLLSFNEKREKMRQRTLKMKGLIDDDEDAEDEPQADLSENKWSFHDNPCTQAWKAIVANPFTRPIPLITTLIVEPLRRRMISPLNKFVVERCIFERKLKKHIRNVINRNILEDKSRVSHADSLKGHTFVYMRDFRERLETFCAQQNLNATNLSTIDIRRLLILGCGCRIKSFRVRRIQGARWAMIPKPVDLGLGPDSTPLEIVQAFFSTHIVITKRNFKDTIDMEDRYGPDGNMRKGLYGVLLKFCQSHGCREFSREQLSPNNTDGALARTCKKLSLEYKEIKVQHIYGMKFVDAEYLAKHGLKVSRQWYLFQFVTVVVHITLLLTPSAFMIVYVMIAQTIYAQTVALDRDVISWMDVLGKYPVGQDTSTMMAPVRWVIIYQLVFCLTTVMRILSHYLELPESFFMQVVAVSYSLLLFLHLFLVTLCIGVICAWFVVATLLDPTKFLPYGTAVVVVILVVKTTYSELIAAAVFLKKSFRKLFDLRLTMALNRAQESLRAEKENAMAEQIYAEGGLRKRRLSWDDEVPVKSADADAQDLIQIKTASPAELFSVLETNEEGSVTVEQFRSLLERLDIGLSSTQMDQLFACCDLDGDGGITEQEMYDSWEFFVSTVMESAAQGAGVGTTDIIFTCVLVCISLVLLLAFVFTALQGWYNESSFDSMIQAVMVSCSGKVVKAVRKKAEAEGDPESVNALVTNLTEGADGDGGDGGDGGGQATTPS